MLECWTLVKNTLINQSVNQSVNRSKHRFLQESWLTTLINQSINRIIDESIVVARVLLVKHINQRIDQSDVAKMLGSNTLINQSINQMIDGCTGCRFAPSRGLL